jgi:hypothetical protein
MFSMPRLEAQRGCQDVCCVLGYPGPACATFPFFACESDLKELFTHLLFSTPPLEPFACLVVPCVCKSKKDGLFSGLPSFRAPWEAEQGGGADSDIVSHHAPGGLLLLSE